MTIGFFFWTKETPSLLFPHREDCLAVSVYWMSNPITQTPLQSLVAGSPLMTDEDHKKTRLLASYIPKLLLKSFMQNGSKPKLPHIDIIKGAVVFADISGRCF